MTIKSIASILLFVLSFFLASCYKTEPGKDRITESTAENKDSIRVTAPAGSDSLKPVIVDKKNDSIKALIEKDRKKKKDSIRSAKEKEIRLTAYYFHPTARCVTCLNIEAYSLEAIQEWEDKNKKKIIWNELNIEDSVNEHYVDEYSLQFSSLVIVKYVGRQKNRWKNLEETWKLVNDKDSFKKYVKFELNQFIKNN